MTTFRPALAIDPRRFGRRIIVHSAAPSEALAQSTAGSDLRLFATTFAAGFLFVSMMLA